MLIDTHAFQGEKKRCEEPVVSWGLTDDQLHYPFAAFLASGTDIATAAMPGWGLIRMRRSRWH